MRGLALPPYAVLPCAATDALLAVVTSPGRDTL